MKIKITEAQLRALKDFAGGRDDFEILYKKVLYRVKNGSSVRDALTDLNVNSRLFYDNLSDEQKHELRSERTAWGITSKTSSVNNKTIPKIKGLSDIRHHKDMMDFLNADKEEYDDNDDLMKEGVIDVASELPEVIKIIIDIIIDRKIDNVVELYKSLYNLDPKKTLQILTIGSDIRPENKEKLKKFFNNSESKKYMVQLKNEVLKNPYAKKVFDYTNSAKEKIDSFLSEGMGGHMSLDDLRKNVMVMLDSGWSTEDIHKIIDHISEIYEKVKNKGISESDEKLKIKTRPIEIELNRLFKDKIIDLQMVSGNPLKVKIDYVTPVFNYVGGLSIIKKIPMENFIEFTFFEGEDEKSLLVDVVQENGKLVAKPEIYVLIIKLS
jgi:hypothetical protein